MLADEIPTFDCQRRILALDLMTGSDIVSETSFVLGMPEDTLESISATIELT